MHRAEPAALEGILDGADGLVVLGAEQAQPARRQRAVVVAAHQVAGVECREDGGDQGL